MATILGLILSIFVALSTQSSVSKLPHGKAVVCYVGTWSVYRPSKGTFNIADINPKLCSHIVYSFMGIDAKTNTLRSIDAYHDLEENYGKGSLRKMTDLKAQNPHLKVTLAVGGWNEGSKNYSDMAMTAAGRKAFVQSAVDWVVKYNFDGFDLDWEFPTDRGGAVEDKKNFALLIKELKQALGKKNLILTAALNPGPALIDRAYDVPEISKHLDLIHLMTYDYHGQWDKKVGSNAPLNGTDNFNVEASIKYLLKLGAPAEKIVVGIAAYGHTFTVEDGVDADMKAPVKEHSFQGPYTRQEGFMGYNEICTELLTNTSWQLLWDTKSSTPYAVNGNSVISFDNERSVDMKVQMALKYRVGGFMVWSIDTDDFRGDCYVDEPNNTGGFKARAYPLLRTIHRTIENYKPQEPVPPMDIPNTIPDSSNAVQLISSHIFLIMTAALNKLF